MILVNKAGRNEPIVLLALRRSVWVEDQTLQHRLVAKCIQAYEYGKADYNISDGHGHNEWAIIRQIWRSIESNKVGFNQAPMKFGS